MTKMHQWGLVLVIGGAAGCASITSQQQTLVCPECRIVVELVLKNDPDNPWATEEVPRQSCPGCQSALATFFSEGKLKHKCSICAQSAFTCSARHPIVKVDNTGKASD